MVTRVELAAGVEVGAGGVGVGVGMRIKPEVCWGAGVSGGRAVLVGRVLGGRVGAGVGAGAQAASATTTRAAGVQCTEQRPLRKPCMGDSPGQYRRGVP